jgi:ribosomal protein S12 methylthiotransferase
MTERRTTSPAIETVAFVSLGCPKNLVDSEKMLGLLAENGLTPIDADGEANAIVINTCGFLEASKVESMEEIHRAAELKRAGACQRLVVAGCLVQRHRAKLLEACPDIDALIGVFDRDRIVEAVRGPSSPPGGDVTIELPVYSSIAGSAAVARAKRGLDDRSAPGYFESDAARLRLTPRHYAYLRMSEGCNQNCTFCTIPSIRGKMRSKPVDAIVSELRELIGDGAFEINLIGQDTTSYGVDIGYAPGLAGLLRTLDQVAGEYGGAWLRLMYAYPSCFTDEMIDAIAGADNIVNYIDMPLQHINNEVLDRMRRNTSRALIDELLTKLRDRVPGIALRTTLISGFPGETDAQHEELVQFVREFGFDALGVFGYSPEPGTPAGSMHGGGQAVPEHIVQQRIDELMGAQQQVAFTRAASLAHDGVSFDVLIDGVADMADKADSPDEPGDTYVGRTCQQAPDIDGVTYVQSIHRLVSGELVPCRVVDADGYDLIALPVSECEPTVALPVLR